MPARSAIRRLIWNRVSYVKDFSTGRRQARPNPPKFWEHAELAELRVVDQELWEAVKARQDALGFAIPATVRARP